MAQIFASERSTLPAKKASTLRKDTPGDTPETALSTLQAQADQSRATNRLMQLQAHGNAASQRREAAGADLQRMPIQRIEEEELMQGKARDQTLQMMGGEEEEMMQGKAKGAALQRQGGAEQNLMQGVEALSGTDMSGVNVHYNSPAPARVQAHAYAQGSNIHVASGQEKHLPHEAWHVAQQRQGRVQPTTQVGGMPVNDDASLEKEADTMGAKASQFAAQSKAS